MSAAPFQLWIDGPPVSLAVRSGGTVTVTTLGSHNLVTGAYVELAGFTGTVGASVNGLYQITATSGSAFTFSSAGSAGTAVTNLSRTTEVFSYDLMSPLDNYPAASRGSATYVILDSMQMSASGDGEAAAMGFIVAQDDTPSSAPWFTTIPDQSRVRLVKADTGTLPSSGQTYFRGFIQNIDSRLNGANMGIVSQVSAVDVNALLDRVVVYGEVRL